MHALSSEKKQMPRIGVLALQGAFREHIIALERCGAWAIPIRNRKDLKNLDGLVLPGGESTVIGKLLNEWNIMQPLRELCKSGVPILGTCAGLILLCTEILDHPEQPRIGLLNASVRRNAFGRQVDSFTTTLHLEPFPVTGTTQVEKTVPPFQAVFIRAPLLERTGSNVQILATQNGQPVAVRQENILATSFHPELTDDLRLHQWVVDTALHGAP